LKETLFEADYLMKTFNGTRNCSCCSSKCWNLFCSLSGSEETSASWHRLWTVIENVEITNQNGEEWSVNNFTKVKMGVKVKEINF
jgi:hypothetical protein